MLETSFDLNFTERPLTKENDGKESDILFRHLFLGTDVINLNPGTLGVPSQSTLNAYLKFFLSPEIARFPLAQYQSGRAHLKNVRTRISSMFGFEEHRIAITNGTTSGLNNIATALYPALTTGITLGPIKVLTTTHEHYGATYGFENHIGYKMFYFDDADLEDADSFREKVLEVGPSIVLISQVTCDLGKLYPVEEFASQLIDLNSPPLMLVDCAQSFGLLPTMPSVGISGIDMVVASCHKWMMGPPGTGILALSDRLTSLIKPFYCNAHNLDEEAVLGFLESSGGQDFGKLAALDHALELYESIGTQNVINKSAALSEYFYSQFYHMMNHFEIEVDYYGAKGLLPTPEALKENDILGVLVVDFKKFDCYPLYTELNSMGIHLKCTKQTYPDGTQMNLLRIGFPFFESTDRLNHVLNQMDEILSQQLQNSKSRSSSHTLNS